MDLGTGSCTLHNRICVTAQCTLLCANLLSKGWYPSRTSWIFLHYPRNSRNFTHSVLSFLVSALLHTDLGSSCAGWGFSVLPQSSTKKQINVAYLNWVGFFSLTSLNIYENKAMEFTPLCAASASLHQVCLTCPQIHSFFSFLAFY